MIENTTLSTAELARLFGWPSQALSSRMTRSTGRARGKRMATTKPKSKMKPTMAKPKADDVRDGSGKAPRQFIPGKGRFVRTDDRKDKPS